MSNAGKSRPSPHAIVLKIITNLWYNLQQNHSTVPSRCEDDFDPSSLLYLDYLTRNRSSINSRTQTIWLKISILCPLICNFYKIFSKRTIFTEGLVSCSLMIGAKSIFQVVSPSKTVPWIKYLISLAVTYVVHWQQHQLICVIQLRGWVIVGCRTFWDLSLH